MNREVKAGVIIGVGMFVLGTMMITGSLSAQFGFNSWIGRGLQSIGMLGTVTSLFFLFAE